MSATQTFAIPQDVGELTPREAEAWQEALLNEKNVANVSDVSERATNLAQGIVAMCDEHMQGLKRRWRGTYYMLSGNTLEKGGPEDVHIPEIDKAIETIVPRIEEQVIGQKPWFRIVPRRKVSRKAAATNEAYIDWQFSQAKIQDQIQPIMRDALVTQTGIWNVWWECRKTMRNEREINRSYDKNGMLVRTVTVKKKEKIDFFGPMAKLVDPFDFIIEPKSTSPQDAAWVGHRAYMTIDKIRAWGKQRGWVNLDKIEDGGTQGSISAGSMTDYWRWPRDPTARYKSHADQTRQKAKGQPKELEVLSMFVRASFDDDKTYDDYLIVIIGGKTVVEVRVNPYDGKYRPYAVVRTSKSGHEFYSKGVFDNAVRLNQHLDAFEQIFLAGARLTGCPMGFAEEDSDLPDSFFKIRPGTIQKGVGAIRFTQIPDGFLRSAPMVTGMIKKDIEELVGAFRINMGQDTGGTATEATLSLQEGNRRTRGLIRSLADGLEQLLTIFQKMNLQFSVEDVEFPVLGKRALNIRRDTMNIGPADLLEDVHFEMIGLRNSRNYGMKATGFQALFNGGMPLIQANLQNMDTLTMLHDFTSEVIGPDEADRYIKIPTPVEDLMSQMDENDALLNGVEVEVDPEDNDVQHLKDLKPLVRLARDPNSDIPTHVRMNILRHNEWHEEQARSKKVREEASARRSNAQAMMRPPEAGGISGPNGSSPVAGGMSNALQQLGMGMPGQTPMENPGPADMRKQPASGGRSRTINQMDNSL